jgi:hypothetical protein
MNLNNLKKNKKVYSLVKNTIKKEKREKNIIIVLFFITLITLSLLSVLLITKLLITGYSAYISSRAGYVTEVNLTRRYPSSYYFGTYGLALRVSGFTEQLYKNYSQGDVERMDLFFDCMESGAVGGNEVFASNSSSIDFDNLTAVNISNIDILVGCSGETQCPSVTYTENMSFLLGTTNISGIPSTHTFRYDGDQSTFDIGVLTDGTNIVYVTHVVSVQRSYNYEKIVNFQMMIPVFTNYSGRYYFFNDPNEECPPGGVGENINATVYGYAFNETGSILSNVGVSVAGYYGITDATGFYNFSFYVVPGTYHVIGTKPGYQTYVSNVSVSFTNYTVYKNITLIAEISPTPPSTNVTPYVYGYVFDETGVIISDANVSMGISTNSTDSAGFYELRPNLYPGEQPIVAAKQGYNNYFYLLDITANTTRVNHNITLSSVQVNYEYPTGPYTSGPYPTGPYTQQVQQQIITSRKKGDDYWISTREINKEVRQNTFVEERVGLYNLKGSLMNVRFSLSANLQDFVKLDKSSMSINPNTFSDLVVTIYGTKPLGSYNGTLSIAGDIVQDIPVTIRVVEKRSFVEALLMELEPFNKVVQPGDDLKYKLNLQNLLREQGYKVKLNIYVDQMNGSEIYSSDIDEIEIENSLTLLKEINIPKNISDGEYLLNVKASYLDYVSSVATPFTVSQPLYMYSVSGIPLWLIFALISFFSFLLLNYLVYKHYKEKKKRYRIMLDYSTLPKPGPRTARIGNIAETKVPAYYEIERLTTHCIVAGATGMGKSISAQVIIEEALINNVAVIVIDPTAQWSGMLRKCTDKKMISFYPKFGLKESDAKGFKGNVKQIINSRELIDINKYMNPGQIQIFSVNKLDPKEIDFFVANFIRQIFKSDPKESPTLKVLIVFDEVHRLLSKFGGSGEGFLQVERCCREFRKWGLGVMLISQVLSDFVGEIKANINTEVQTRTLEETDLERIRVKYGDEFLKSLVRAEVGVAMFQNAEYNRGRPYFINFRPILHNTRRLSDEELEKYNKYNEQVDDIEDQIEQLEKEKVDAFDLKMELKLIKDKVMTGNFSVVDIYLEGLVPRVAKEWEKIGKKPKKHEVLLVNEAEVKQSTEEARKAREKIIEEEKKSKEKIPDKITEVKTENKDEKKVEAKDESNIIKTPEVKTENKNEKKDESNIIKTPEVKTENKDEKKAS